MESYRKELYSKLLHPSLVDGLQEPLTRILSYISSSCQTYVKNRDIFASPLDQSGSYFNALGRIKFLGQMSGSLQPFCEIPSPEISLSLALPC